MPNLKLVDIPADYLPDGSRYTLWHQQPTWNMWKCPYASHQEPGRLHCYVIRFPDPCWCWHTNHRSSEQNEFWTVTYPLGHPELVTVQPSIRFVGNPTDYWHGFITNGVVSEC